MIETGRLVLREHRIADFRAYIALWTQRLADPRGGYRFPPLSDEEVWARLLRWIGHRKAFGYAPFLVFERSSGRLAGEVGFGHFQRGNGDDFDGSPEAMWTLHPDFHGNGLAGEAALAAVRWADENIPAARHVCMIEPDNEASLRVAARVGFREFRRTIYRRKVNLLLERLVEAS